MNWFPWFLFAHVLGAVIAFGPTFSLPILGRMGGAEKQHGNFATRVSLAISKQRIVPLAILQGITGVGLIVTGNVDLGRALWLNIAIVLYLIALGFALFVQTPTAQAIVRLTSGPPAAPGGPPPEPSPLLFPLIRRSQLGGMFLAGLIVVIVFLMVVKPQF